METAVGMGTTVHKRNVLCSWPQWFMWHSLNASVCLKIVLHLPQSLGSAGAYENEGGSGIIVGHGTVWAVSWIVALRDVA